MIKVEIKGAENKIDLDMHGGAMEITAELMCIIQEILIAFGESDESIKEIAKGFLIESIGEL